jgi:hypothetical protein
MIPDPFPKHPASEFWSAVFHAGATLVCAAHLVPALRPLLPATHVLLGTLGGWFHIVSTLRHWRDR